MTAAAVGMVFVRRERAQSNLTGVTTLGVTTLGVSKLGVTTLGVTTLGVTKLARVREAIGTMRATLVIILPSS